MHTSTSTNKKIIKLFETHRKISIQNIINVKNDIQMRKAWRQCSKCLWSMLSKLSFATV